MLQSLDLLCGPSLDCLSTSVFALYRQAKNWTQHSEGGLTDAEQRGRIPSLDLLAVLCLMQPRISLAAFVVRVYCWLMFNFMSTMIPSSFSAMMSSKWSSSSLDLVSGVILPQVQDFILILLKHEKVRVMLLSS